LTHGSVDGNQPWKFYYSPDRGFKYKAMLIDAG